jgi:uncharacterized protein YkwD
MTYRRTVISLAVLTIISLSVVGFLAFNPRSRDHEVNVKTSEVAEPKLNSPPSLLELTNQARSTDGLPALTNSPLLEKSAANKCADMIARNYWSHNTPDGAEPWVFITPYIPEYYKLGENLASDYPNDLFAHQNWMNSPIHKANILDPEFNQVGFAKCQKSDNKYIIVQHFAG